MFGFLIAILSGALMSVQGVFNTQVTKQTEQFNHICDNKLRKHDQKRCLCRT